MTREALKLALEALELHLTHHEHGCVYLDPAVTAIKEALAQPEQEPVVWMYQDKSTHQVSFQKYMRAFVDHGATYETPLYTTPPQRKPLTDEEISRLWSQSLADTEGETYLPLNEFARAIEAKLRSKNT